MANLNVNYLGLKLDNPLIVGSSGLTESIDGLKEIQKFNPGAVVLKSLFEEEIMLEMENEIIKMVSNSHIYPEIYDYFDTLESEDSVSKYLSFIELAKKTVKMPIIASINCVTASEWISFAKRIESAGADAIELNAFILPSDFDRTGAENEQLYFDIIKKIKAEVKIPISMKISYYFSNLARFVQDLSETEIDGIVMFNRFFDPDIDMEKMIIKPANIYSNPSDIYRTLRWIAILANRVNCDISASTGVHDSDGMIKQLLVGANTVQVASVLYQKGIPYIDTLLTNLDKWMSVNGFETINDFRGKLSQSTSLNPAAFERVQFMKHFAGK